MKMKRWISLLLAILMMVCCLVGCGSAEKEESTTGGTSKLSDLSGKKIGVVTGSIQAIKLPQIVPNANYLEFNTYADLIAAFNGKKVDAFSTDESIYKAMLWEDQNVTRIDEALDLSDYGMIFTKGADLDLQNKVNDYIAKIKSDGTHKTLEEKWFGDSEPAEFASYEDLDDTNGTLKIGVSSASKPFVYIKNGKYTGYEVELMIGFCREYGYGLAFEDTAFAAIMAGVSSGKYNIGMSGITITDERKESVDFSDVNHTEDLVLVVHESGNKKESTGIAQLSDLSGKKIGIVTGTLTSVLVPQLVPDAVYVEFNSTADAKMALESEKVDAFPTDESVYLAMRWEGNAVDRVDEAVAPSDYGILFGKGKNLDLQKQMNEYIAKIKADGTHQALQEKWFGAQEPEEFASYGNLTGENGTLKVGICSSSKPFTYLKNGQFAGYDVEVIVGFCREYGYKVVFEDTLFASVLAGVASGNYDMGAAGFTITDERKESVDFSDVYHTEDLVLVVRGQKAQSGGKTLADFRNAKVGVLQGSYVATFADKLFPDGEVIEFNTISDSILALQQGKVDVVPNDESIYVCLKWEGKNVAKLDEVIETSDYGMVFPKDGDPKLLSEMNSFIQRIKEDGTLRELDNKWFSDKEPTEFLSYDQLSGENGTIRIGTNSEVMPFAYMKNNGLVGFEIELLTLFAEEYGYALDFENVAFPSILAGVTSGKYDIGIAGFTITEERKQSVNFCDSHHQEDIILIVQGEEKEESGFAKIRESFEKTFIREQRWKLIVEGVCTTLIISFFAVLGGTVLGFGLYMLSRSQIQWLSALTKGIARVYAMIIAGTPTLVVLMILFYLVFTSPNASGVVVAIIGFILTFGSFVYDNLELTVSGVDNGQLEAAYALGYSRNQTFFRIILPQAMRMFVPSYSSEIVALVKSTSVVGYIAVNDLTKMGDIIRGNTYEAFFPLIAVAVIYFAIIWIITALLGILKKKTNPKARKEKNILKGVVR